MNGARLIRNGERQRWTIMGTVNASHGPVELVGSKTPSGGVVRITREEAVGTRLQRLTEGQDEVANRLLWQGRRLARPPLARGLVRDGHSLLARTFNNLHHLLRLDHAMLRPARRCLETLRARKGTLT